MGSIFAVYSSIVHTYRRLNMPMPPSIAICIWIRNTIHKILQRTKFLFRFGKLVRLFNLLVSLSLPFPHKKTEKPIYPKTRMEWKMIRLLSDFTFFLAHHKYIRRHLYQLRIHISVGNISARKYDYLLSELFIMRPNEFAIDIQWWSNISISIHIMCMLHKATHTHTHWISESYHNCIRCLWLLHSISSFFVCIHDCIKMSWVFGDIYKLEQ